MNKVIGVKFKDSGKIYYFDQFEEKLEVPKSTQRIEINIAALSFVNREFHFSEIIFNCLFFKNNYLRQLIYNTTGSYACQP